MFTFKPVNSHHKIVKALLEICAAKGVTHFVFSPGSRNAPIAVAVFNDKRFITKVIADERSAGFIAMGMALELGKPVVVCCTSGTAVLNYAPAVAEAHHQNIPLLVISADRPEEFIGQGEGQSINQKNALANFVNGSYHLPRTLIDKEAEWHTERLLNEAVDACYLGKPGPVHINMPFNEPLYGTSEDLAAYHPKIITPLKGSNTLPDSELANLMEVWNGAEKKLILCGQMPNNKRLNHVLNQLADNDPSVVVVAENVSNLQGNRFITCVDRVIESINSQNQEQFTPDILITIGDAVVSKKVKTLLRKMPITHCWDVSENRHHYDTYQQLTHDIHTSPEYLFFEILKHKTVLESNFYSSWKTLDYKNKEAHNSFLSQAPYSDFTSFATVLDFIPEGVALHLSNSSVIRYTQLFDSIKDVVYYSNRGVSGIDGSTSTALGCSLVNHKVNVLITGDVSFFYDSNALWNKYLHSKFKIILINNSGGGIFRIIPGPSDTEILEEFFETKQSYSAEHLCKTFGLEYLFADSIETLEQQMEPFLTSFDAPMLLEIQTPNALNAEVLKDYFKHINKGL
jgi:2-succinyl-5-enolpyruvyl-6-hydroxy-3-cyclohexene-1-carboxylate synthase